MDTTTELRARLNHHAVRLPGTRFFTRAHVALLRIGGGRIGGRWGGMPVLVLSTTGRRTGKLRSSPVTFLRDGDEFVVLPAAAGSDRTPAWWLNLRSASAATVLVDGRRSAVHARVADQDERARLWPRFAQAYPDIDAFRRFTTRELTFGILSPDNGSSDTALAAGSRSDELGARRSVRTGHGEIHYRERGAGPVLLFVHGLWVNGDVWRKVVPLLAQRYRCITPDWPFGAHRPTLNPDADLTPDGIAELFAEVVGALDLRDVTLVANDTGVAFTQVFVAKYPNMLARLVITPGDVARNFLAVGVKWMRPAAMIPATMAPIARMWNTGPGRRIVIGVLTKRLPPSDVLDSWFTPAVREPAVRRDLAKLLRSASPRATLAAERGLHMFPGPTLIIWTMAWDPVFPLRHAHRLQRLIPGARLELVSDTRGFVSEDQPHRLAALIDGFVAG